MNRKLRAGLFASLLGLLGGQHAEAQSPGGVQPAAWYRADAAGLYSDAGTTPVTDNSQVYQWNEALSSGYNLLQASAGRRPVYSNSTTLANFNPTVTFDGSNDLMEFTAGTGINVIDRADGSLVAAGYMDRQKGSGFAGFHSSMDYPGLHVYNNYKLLFFTAGGPGYQGVSTEAMLPKAYFTAGSAWENAQGGTPAYLSATVSLNGQRNDYIGNNIYNVQATNNNARNFRIGADSNWGAFSGQLNEVLVYENRLTGAEMDQVESYLSIKYGTTYANGSRDYKNSAGATVWNSASNAGYQHNIAGIARDDNGALYQKQSWSTNEGQQVLIGTGALAGTNAANSGTLANGQYLIWGDNGLAKAPTVATTAFTGLSHHFAAIWRVQNTGTVGTVRVAWPKSFSNLTLIQSNDATIDGSDASTVMSSETIINGIAYNYAEVTLTNGTYFTFGAKLSGPGGVTAGLMMWHKADDGTTAAGPKDIWRDVSGLGRDVTQNNNEAYRPILVTGAAHAADSKEYTFNFNPFYYFDGSNDFFYRNGDSYFSTNNTPGSAYGVMFNSANSGWRTSYGWGDDDPNLVRGNDSYYVTRDNGTVISQNTGLNSLPAHIGGMAWKGSGAANNGIYLNVNGRIYPTTSYNIGSLNSAQNFAIGSEGYNLAGNGFEVYQGGIAEVFAYETDHQNSTGDEKQRINSYLAIKYGITLSDDAGTGVPDYLSSNSAVIWDATENAAYNNNIAGIARDDNSALYQKQSRSNRSGQQLLIGTAGLANSNAENSTALNEGQFLIWGDNGLGKSLGVAHNTVAGGLDLNLRFAAVWKVQNTGAVGTVRVTWPSGIVNLHLIQSADDVIETTDVHTAMTGTTTVNGVIYNYADVTLADGSYFTFGGYVAGPGGVGEDLSLWYRADNGVETDVNKKVTGWNNSTANEVKLAMSSASAYIPYNDQTTYTKTWNFNPTLSFDGTNNYLRNTTTPYLDAAGSVHYIAVARLNPGASGYNSIFAVSGNDDGFFLQQDGSLLGGMPTIGNGFSVAASGPHSADRFGIYSAILPKTGSPANQRGFNNGLEKIYTSPYPRTGAAYSLPTTGAYLGADGTTGDNPTGEIAEVILYHEPEGGDMNNADLHRIHSYLAIKYGITLDQSTPQDYINSGSSVVWDADANSGYHHHIAGIARDDQGGLYQKQSNSVNPGSQVLISTTGLAGTNAANTAPLNNGQFLIWGDNGLAKGPAVAIAGIPDVNYRFGSIWKVQNTNSVGTVRVAWRKSFANLKLIQSEDEVIENTDLITDMSGSQVVNGIEYAYADVSLSDGQYFTFAAFIQAPGGVTNNLSYWYRADKLVDAVVEDEDVDSWTDFTSGTVISQLGENALPKFKNGQATYFNFNPGVNYTNSAQALGNINVQTVTSLNYDIYTLTKEGISPGGNGRVFSSLVDNVSLTGSIWHWDGIGLMADNRIERVNTARNNRYLANPGSISYAGTHPSIMYNTFTDLSISKGINGAPKGTEGTHTARGQMTGGHAIGSTQFSGNGSDNAGFTGNIGEVVVYGNGNNTAAERNKVESYLAIKYGLTLQSSNHYTTSGDVVVWDAAANTEYYNNVAGVGNDFLSALHQKQSRSQHPNTNNQVIIGLGEIAETNIANTNALADGQFLVWGDNGNTQAMTNSSATFTEFSYAGGTNNARRMKRVWKVQNTSVSGEMLIRFPVSSVGTTTLPEGDACGDYVILFADDAGFTTNLTVVPLTVNNSDYEVSHTFPGGMSYFTFAKLTPLSSGIVYLPGVVEQTTEYADNCGVGEWTYFHKTGDPSEYLFATAVFSQAERDNFQVTVTPEGTAYSDGSRETALMARIATVTDGNASLAAPGKVRIYYSQDELDAAIVPGVSDQGWFKYEGDAGEVVVDIYSDGLLDPVKAEFLTPDATGVEDGVSYVEFHNISSFSSFGYLSTTDDSALPVTLAYFKGHKNENAVLLEWATSAEFSNSGFEIQRSTDARNWEKLGFVTSAGEGDRSGTPLSYRFTDHNPLDGNNYYRLKQTDLNGEFEYSPVIVMNFRLNINLSVFPNPVLTGELTLDAPGKVVEEAKVYNLTGVRMNVSMLEGRRLNVSTLPAGQYLLRVVFKSGEVVTRSFIVQ